MSALACQRRRRWSTARIRSAPADDAHSQGADLVLDKVAWAPGFSIGNVIVQASSTGTAMRERCA